LEVEVEVEVEEEEEEIVPVCDDDMFYMLNIE